MFIALAVAIGCIVQVHANLSAEEKIRVKEGSCSIINEPIQSFSTSLPSTDTDKSSRVLSATVASGVTTGHLKINTSDDNSANTGNSSFIDDTLNDLSVHLAELGNYVENIPSSCKDIQDKYPSAPSGSYTVSDNGKLNEVYCYMDGSNCGGGVWTRIAHYNMSEPNAVCPNGLAFHQYSNIDHPLCARPKESYSGCISLFFPSNGLSFSYVCGRIRGYQYNSPDGFYPNIGDESNDINDRYVDGYSITYGSPRQHIWSFAGGLEQTVTHGAAFASCPCSSHGDATPPPSYVGSDYYCESGLPIGDDWSGGLYVNDPLWDGEQCLGEEASCCDHPNLPWFSKNLGTSTTEDVEVRLCGTQTSADEDTPFDILELYVH